MPDTKSEIIARLQSAFSPSHLDVFDESHQHQGHGGYQEGVVTHVRVRISSEQLLGQTRLAQHRAINACLADMMNNPIHALAIEVT